MVKDTINLIDKDYNLVNKDSHLSNNQLRTRPSSFASIRNAWRNWRISLAEKKLEKKKKDLLNQEFRADENGKLTDASNNIMLQKTKAIATLEQKIKFLSKEVVPRSFVATHAIKLRKKMYDNLKLNGDNVYVVGADKYDEVFNSEPIIPEDNAKVEIPSEVLSDIPSVVPTVPVEDVPEVGEMNIPENDGVEVVPSEIQRESIQSVIDNEFNKIKKSQNVVMVPPEDVAEAVKNVSPITRSDIASEIDAQMNQIGDNTSVDDVSPITRSDIASEIDAQMNQVDTSLDNSQDIKEEIESVFEDVDTHLNDIKANQNGSSPARIDHFDENGDSIDKNWIGEEKINKDDFENFSSIPVNDEKVTPSPVDVPVEEIPSEVQMDTPKSKEWVPLTDEQIAAFRKDLEEHPIVSTMPEVEEDFTIPNVTFPDDLENGNQSDALREKIVVTPERIELPVEEKVDESINIPEESEPRVDYSNDILNIDHETSMEELQRLRERVEGLLARQRASKKAMDEAERMDQNAAERAAEVLRAREESDLAREVSIGKLREYGDALEEDCNFNENRARIAIENAECNERFIELQREKIRDNDELIDAMSSLIGPEAVNVRRR